MKPTTKTTLTACLALIALLAVSGSAAAQHQPSSDLLLPWFEVDADPTGVTTLFAVGNATDKPVDVHATVFTNWGVPILKVPFTLQAREIKTVNLRDWFKNGGDPKKALAAIEIEHLAAAASGQRSPKDKLYYSTEVRLDAKVGYVTLRTQGNRPDALWGDWFLVDVHGNLAGGDVLVNIDRSTGCPGLCQRHLLRYLNGGGFDGGTELIIWRETVNAPSSVPDPGYRLQADATAFNEPGLAIENRTLSLLPVETVQVRELGLKEPFGSLDVESEAETFIGVKHTAETRYAVAYQTYCLARKRKPGPAIEIVKLTNGADANHVPGPTIAVGETVTWEYLVTNIGAVELTDIEVTDDQGEQVSCPEDTLAPGESMTCTASGKAQACQYTNTGTATGLPPTGPEVNDSDVSHYFGDEGGALSVSVLLNGQPAGTSPGSKVQAGTQLDWSFQISNTGKVRLTGIELDGIAASCPGSALDPGKSMTCTANGGKAVEGAQSIAVKASGQTSCSSAAATGNGYYTGDCPGCGEDEAPVLRIVKLTNGQDANEAPGPSIAVGSPVAWKYEVTNIGKVEAQNVKVTDDDPGVTVSCPKTNLKVDESMICEAGGIAKGDIAKGCQYKNVGTATGTSPSGIPGSAHDPSHYKGTYSPAIDIETAVNGNDADTPTGPDIPVGSPVSFTYVVKNTGNSPLTGIQVNDSKGLSLSCPKTSLAAGESMTCTANGTSQSGQYSSVGTATGNPPCDGQAVSDTDPVHYFGPDPDEPNIDIVKLTNGQDANTAPGPEIPVGGTVKWEYVVTNTGNTTLSNVKVTDDKGVAVSCPKTTLAKGESMTCTGYGKAQACQYQNLGTATGKAPNGQTVSDEDPSHYYGKTYPSIEVEAKINGDHADTPTGPEFPVGATVPFTYWVKNTGNVTLTGIAVSDSKGVAVTCPKTSLNPGESMSCSGSGIAQAGQYSAVATATGNDPCGKPVSDDDPVHYYGKGENPGIKIVKLTNGQDANTAPGPEIPVGGTVKWEYVVTNTGDTTLSNVKVTDDKGVAVSCPKTTLAKGESMTCTGYGKAQACQYMNLGTATGKSPAGQTVTDDDPSHYWGKTYPAIEVEAKINGDHADTPTGPEFPVGATVPFTYWVKNTGDTTLTGITVTDSKGVAVTCPKTTLTAGESMFCSGSGIAQAGQYSAVATATGKGSCDKSVSDDDPVHYYGKTVKADEGCTPGYWKNHTDSWPPTGYSPSQKVQGVFSKASLYPTLGNATLLQALSFSGGSDLTGAAGNLLRAATAALLNSAHSGVDYPWVTAQVISEVNDALASKDRDTILDLAGDLDDDNNLGCPLN